MVLTDDRRKALAEYCRVDDDDALLSGFFIAATGYMETAGIREPEIGSPRAAQYDLCVNYLVLDMYDRRDVSLAGTVVADNPAFRRMVNQLKLSEPVSDSGTVYISIMSATPSGVALCISASGSVCSTATYSHRKPPA